MSFEPGILFVALMFVWLVYILTFDTTDKKDFMDDDTEEKEPEKKEGKKNV